MNSNIIKNLSFTKSQIDSFIKYNALAFFEIIGLDISVSDFDNLIVNTSNLEINDEFYIQEDCCQLGCCCYPECKKDNCITCDLHKVNKYRVKNIKIERFDDIVEIDTILKFGFPKQSVDEDGLIIYEWFNDYFDEVCKEKKLDISHENNPYFFIYELELQINNNIN